MRYQLHLRALTSGDRLKDEDVIGGYQKGADCYVTKPLQPKVLLNVVDYLIGDLSPEEKAKLEPLL